MPAVAEAAFAECEHLRRLQSEDEGRAPDLVLVHGAVMLWIDGQLESAATEADFLELVDEITAGLA